MVHFAWTVNSVCRNFVENIGLKCTFRYFFESFVHTNHNIPSNRYWSKIWCVLLEQRSHSAWISYTCSTKLKSSFPLDKQRLETGLIISFYPFNLLQLQPWLRIMANSNGWVITQQHNNQVSQSSSCILSPCQRITYLAPMLYVGFGGSS